MSPAVATEPQPLGPGPLPPEPIRFEARRWTLPEAHFQAFIAGTKRGRIQAYINMARDAYDPYQRSFYVRLARRLNHQYVWELSQMLKAVRS